MGLLGEEFHLSLPHWTAQLQWEQNVSLKPPGLHDAGYPSQPTSQNQKIMIICVDLRPIHFIQSSVPFLVLS